MSLNIKLDRRLLILTFGDAVVHDPKKGELGFLVAQAGHQLNVLGCLWVYHRGLISNLPKKADYILFLKYGGESPKNLLTNCSGDMFLLPQKITQEEFKNSYNIKCIVVSYTWPKYL